MTQGYNDEFCLTNNIISQLMLKKIWNRNSRHDFENKSEIVQITVRVKRKQCNEDDNVSFGHHKF